MITIIKYLLLSSIITISVLLSFSLQGTASGSVVVDRVVAVVNDEIITLSDLQREEEISKKVSGKKDDRLILEDMIDRKLQMAAAKRVGMDVTDKELADAITDIMKRNNMDSKQFEAALAKEGLSFEQYKAELKEQITLSRMFNKYVRTGIAVDEAEARAFYQNNIKNYTLPQEIRVRQIFLRVPEKATPEQLATIKEKAMKIYDRAQKGENFIHLVHEVSEGVTASQDGDLGFIQKDQAIPEIAEATQSLNTGEISQPFFGAGGYNIIFLEETRTPVRPFEKVKDEIMNTLYQQKIENTYRGWLQTLRSDSHIENRL
ncbi:MAG TPA: peptidylprolyl isomerase [Nitrospirota bacterium]|nr:peptidylprolyl isomerase [Nitrospirota bacterium]